MLRYPTLLGALAALVSLAGADEVACYAPDGVTLGNNESFVPCNKLGITQTGVYSSCCRLDGDPAQRDLCATTGLCLNGGVIYREYCTDKTWKSPACVSVCTDPATGGSADDIIEMTPCTDGTYCCGSQNLTCCGTEHAVVVPTQVSVDADDDADADANSRSGQAASAYKSATIALAVLAGVFLLAGAAAAAHLGRRDRAHRAELGEVREKLAAAVSAARNPSPPPPPPPPPVQQQQQQYSPYHSPQFGPKAHPYQHHLSSPPGSPGMPLEAADGGGGGVNPSRFSELDASVVATRSEMGSPPPPPFEHGHHEYGGNQHHHQHQHQHHQSSQDYGSPMPSPPMRP
ncbi:hypothetical protein F4780DRAFT_737812 [Xylariomycetidae sp. FL0641]|nr:hypothetical protein F4780DRAFT_737812 [Xylariomycetidae sp. FL0641]